MEFGGFGWLLQSLVGAPLSADLIIEERPRSPDGSLSDKQTFEYRLYRDGRGRTSIISQESAKEPTPVQIFDPPGQTVLLFDATARRVYQLASSGVSAYVNPLRDMRGKYSSKREGPARAEINGIECMRVRSADTLTDRPDGGPDVQAVTETCRSPALGLILEHTSTLPSGEAHVTVTNIQRAEPPPEVFAVPPGYTIVDVTVPGLQPPPPPPPAR